MTTVACVLGLYWNRDRPSIRLLVGVAMGLLISVLNVNQALVQAVSLGLILLAVASVYRARRGQLTHELVVLALLLVFLKLNFFPTEGLIGAGLGTLLVVVADLYESREEPRRCLALAALGAGFGPLAVCPPCSRLRGSDWGLLWRAWGPLPGSGPTPGPA